MCSFSVLLAAADNQKRRQINESAFIKWFWRCSVHSELSNKLGMTAGTEMYSTMHNAAHKLLTNTMCSISHNFTFREKCYTLETHLIQLKPFKWPLWKWSNCQSWGIFPTGFDTQVWHWRSVKGLIHWSVFHIKAGIEKKRDQPGQGIR